MLSRKTDPAHEEEKATWEETLGWLFSWSLGRVVAWFAVMRSPVAALPSGVVQVVLLCSVEGKDAGVLHPPCRY